MLRSQGTWELSIQAQELQRVVWPGSCCHSNQLIGYHHLCCSSLAQPRSTSLGQVTQGHIYTGLSVGQVIQGHATLYSVCWSGDPGPHLHCVLSVGQVIQGHATLYSVCWSGDPGPHLHCVLSVGQVIQSHHYTVYCLLVR